MTLNHIFWFVTGLTLAIAGLAGVAHYAFHPREPKSTNEEYEQ